MTILKSKVSRESLATRHEQGKRRAIMISLEPPALIGVRLKGTRRTYFLDAEVLYCIAVKNALTEEKKGRKR